MVKSLVEVLHILDFHDKQNTGIHLIFIGVLHLDIERMLDLLQKIIENG